MLEEALCRLGVPIREERMPEESAIGGGLCVVRGKVTVIISPMLGISDKVEVFVGALKRINTDSIWLPPAVRELLEG
jgi:hypothetical protein